MQKIRKITSLASAKDFVEGVGNAPEIALPDEYFVGMMEGEERLRFFFHEVGR